MGILQKITKGKEIEVRGIKFNIKPLNTEHFDMFLEMEDDSKKVKVIKEIVFVTLNTANEAFDKEDLAELTIKELLDLFKEISELNGLSE